MKIGIFCSANNSIDPVYFEKTAELGRWMVKNGHSIVYGGCDTGLMECVAKAVCEAGGQTVGVIPSIVEKGGHASDHALVKVMCDNLSDRKALLLAHSDVLVALPGGVGTLDEVFTVAAAATIGYHHKRTILYNINGFWNSLVALLNDLQAKGMIRGDWRRFVAVAESLDEIGSFL
ncbi:MAG: TIGR00730 family Rossman fold protein [Prevotellaceae bacterium]|nr:TIGR00730 family Rossman fold protein [Prevotella sp.]MDD7257450.1 TIGR00730 family Rossman fold protein [Prevotellaceae bacterium]MDY6129828.1 TIGR00730 family Rossman fold protein [Prevotella sp.]